LYLSWRVKERRAILLAKMKYIDEFNKWFIILNGLLSCVSSSDEGIQKQMRMLRGVKKRHKGYRTGFKFANRTYV